MRWWESSNFIAHTRVLVEQERQSTTYEYMDGLCDRGRQCYAITPIVRPLPTYSYGQTVFDVTPACDYNIFFEQSTNDFNAGTPDYWKLHYDRSHFRPQINILITRKNKMALYLATSTFRCFTISFLIVFYNRFIRFALQTELLHCTGWLTFTMVLLDFAWVISSSLVIKLGVWDAQQPMIPLRTSIKSHDFEVTWKRNIEHHDQAFRCRHPSQI